MSVSLPAEIRDLLRPRSTPCVSLYMPTHEAGAEMQQDPIRLKNLLREAEEQLVAAGSERGFARELLRPAHEKLDEGLFWRHQERGLAVFLGDGANRLQRLPHDVPEMVVVGRRFHLVPILPLLQEDFRYHLLAFSQKRVRFFDGDRNGARQREAPGLPTSLADALGHDVTQPTLQFHTAAPRPGGGRRVAIFHGHGAGAEDPKQEVVRFLRALDNALLAHLPHADPPSLVLAAVDYEIDHYRKITKHPRVVPGGVEGNPDDLSAEELHERSWPLVRPLIEAQRVRALERLRERAGTGLASTDPTEVVLGALDGRVDTLFVTPHEHLWGAADPGTREVRVLPEPAAGAEDLLNLAALETLQHGGTVYAFRNGDRPAGGEPLAALFRH